MVLRLESELEAVCRALDEAGVDYALCGGLVVAIYGYPRMTRDIDILIREETLTAALGSVDPLGYRIEGGRISLETPDDPGSDLYRIMKFDGPDFMTLDFLFVNARLERVWETRQRVEWNQLLLGIVSREGLAIMKRLSGRPRDLLDLQELGLDDDSVSDDRR